LEPTTYTVVAGDTLFEIATAQGVTLEALNEANELSTDVIEIGQVLVIPAPTEVKASSPRRRARPTAPLTSTGPEAWGLKLPPPKECLAGPSAGSANESDLAFSISLGLEVGAANMALRAFGPHTLKCMPMEPTFAPQSPLDLDLHVGCDGQVIAVSVQSNGEWPEEVTRCVSDVLRYVPFPAHALPDGDWIRYPLTFTR
jgi:LysM repeat protein